MKQRYHLKLTLQRNPLGKLSLVGIHTPQPALHKVFEPHKVTITSVDVPNIDSVKTSMSEPSSMDISLPVEADVDLDILAAMDDPPVLEQFASLPLPSHTYTLASYVEHSVTLQKLVELGVDLSKVEKKEGIPTELLKMDFETDIQEKLIYLNSIGVAGEKLGRFVTRNPHILLEEVEELQARVGYLKSKKFSDVAISQIVNRAPYFLSFSVLRVDRKLGYLQQLLDLKGTEVREVITKEPRLVTFKVSKIQENVFVIREQLGFRKSELKSLIIKEPKLLLRGKESMIGIFDYVHNVMEIPHQVMLQTPKVFASRLHKIQERHQFLKSINRDNYDSTQPQYIPLEKLSRVPDSIFCNEIAKKPLEEYNAFLKTL
ncbi:putative transcription termination factor 3, mitochondrial-like [Apostichopus japonicus]|uniref:Transcription termination factor 3, mitochondrial n=1 Tax=Stichopus japonicus TaxID=307972 RepID=A0A2G8JQ89_STIJA|nr:putative transcription termination factor 3, mitochondrial-like [Apostichopus japonicus]